MNKSEMNNWTEAGMGKAVAEMIVQRHNKKNKGTKKKISQVARF